MPAKVTVQSGISAGTTHWIERPVVRIGSDPQSDVCLPSADVAAHALTLEYRDGGYRVYNRCRNNVFIGMQAVQPGQALAWSDTDILHLSDDIELVLDLDEDPSPQPMRRTASVQESEEDISGNELDRNIAEGLRAEAEPVRADNSRFFTQLVVTILCFAGCAVLLGREAIKGKDAGSQKAPAFIEVVRHANSSGISVGLIQRLQFAESAAIRGNLKSARQRYGSLRDDLLPLQKLFAADGRESELAIIDFVNYRLGRLER